MIRAKWGLNDLLPDHNYSDAKNRKDHRHHAIDAFVAALTDRKLLHRMSTAYDEERQKIEIPLPWPTLRPISTPVRQYLVVFANRHENTMPKL